MAQTSELRRLEMRRLLLVEESGRLRDRLAGPVSQIGGSLAWVDAGYGLVRRIQPFWPVAAAVGGFLLARKRSRPLTLLGKLATGWRLAGTVVGLWRKFTPAARK